MGQVENVKSGGSVKDRPALRMVEKLKDKGCLNLDTH